MLFDQISNDIKEAMKARDKVRLETLRNVKKVFLEAKTAPGANDELSDEAAMKIIQKLAKQGRDAASIYEGQGRADLAGTENYNFHFRVPPEKGSSYLLKISHFAAKCNYPIRRSSFRLKNRAKRSFSRSKGRKIRQEALIFQENPPLRAILYQGTPTA